MKIKHLYYKLKAYLTFSKRVVFSEFIEINQANLNEQILGGFYKVGNKITIQDNGRLAFDFGIGQIFISVIDIDKSCNLTITGTKVDKDTGEYFENFTEEIAIDELTNDESYADENANEVHIFKNGYITKNYFVGSVVIHVTDEILFDIYNILFEGVNNSLVQFDTVDASLYSTNSAAWFSMYVYCLKTNGNSANISKMSELTLYNKDVYAGRGYKLRKNKINYKFNGDTDGIWTEVFFGQNNQNDWRNISLKLWFNHY